MRSSLCNLKRSLRRKNAKEAPLDVDLSAYLRFRGTCKKKRTSARTPTSTPMRVNTRRTYNPQQQHGTRCGTHANHGSTCCGCPSAQRRTFLCLFLLFSEETVSETSKVTPRHWVTRFRRTRGVHQKTWGANDSQSVRWSKTGPPVSNCKREVQH